MRSLGLLDGKMLTTFYGYDITHRAMGENYYQNLFSNSDIFIVISNFIRENAISAGFDKNKIVVLPIGVNPGEFIPYKQKTDKNCIRLLRVARLVEKKDCTNPSQLFTSL